MPYDPTAHHRRSIRLDGYDYSESGAYFVTFCAHQRRMHFGQIKSGKARLNAAGEMIERAWGELPKHYPFIDVDSLIVMPNHMHGIIIIGDALVTAPQVPAGDAPHGTAPERKNGQARSSIPGTVVQARPFGTAAGSLARVLQGFKSTTTNLYIRGVKEEGWPAFDKHLWQRDYFEHVIRDDDSLAAIRHYIETNPERWGRDLENPDGTGADNVEVWVRELLRPPIAAGEAGGDRLKQTKRVWAVGDGRTQGSPLRGNPGRESETLSAADGGRTRGSPLRVGHGYDLHRLQPGGVLMLGGVAVSSDLSPIAHSDGDVVLHAIVDALLGAMGWGDIGEHFANDDARWKNAASRVFVDEVMGKVLAAGYCVQNLDVTILAERPKLKAFKPAIGKMVAELLHVDAGQVNIKAGTNEGCDSIGRGEAIAAHAVVLLAHDEIKAR